MDTSGMRFKKLRLIAPIRPLKPKMMANCQFAGCAPKQMAAIIVVTKLPNCTHAASRDTYRPRIVGGTSKVIQGSQALLEMPRERLNAKSNANMSASRETLLRNALV